MRIPEFLVRRPRVVNLLHRMYLVQPHTQTNEEELSCLERHAGGRGVAVEIGTHQGVSAARIAAKLDGAHPRLFCIDPWLITSGTENPSYKICIRHLTRTDTISRISILRGTAPEVQDRLPAALDFAFIDGDHVMISLPDTIKVGGRRSYDLHRQI